MGGRGQGRVMDGTYWKYWESSSNETAEITVQTGWASGWAWPTGWNWVWPRTGWAWAWPRTGLQMGP